MGVQTLYNGSPVHIQKNVERQLKGHFINVLNDDGLIIRIIYEIKLISNSY